MDFAGIGKISSFAKQKSLVFAANYRIKTGQSIVDNSGRLTLTKSTMFNAVQTSKKNSISTADKARLASIKQKLKSGKKLSTAEMNYLKEKDPSTYKKAKYADETREELKKELRNVETKQEAREAVMRAMAKIAADCSADLEALQGGAGGGINFGGGEMNFGANMNVGGDTSISMNVDGSGTENLNVEGAKTLSTENISVDTQNVGGEISGVENSAVGENISNAQNIFSQFGEENSDSAFDILDKYIYAVRAVQDEWLNFTKSDEYKDLPENILEKIPSMKIIDAIFAYKKSMNYRLAE